MFWGRGWRNWYRMTGLPGWMRAYMGLPAWGRCWWYPLASSSCYSPFLDVQQEMDMLKVEEAILKEELNAIQRRLSELEKEIKKGGD